jgi:hypothetical protein
LSHQNVQVCTKGTWIQAHLLFSELHADTNGIDTVRVQMIHKGHN